MKEPPKERAPKALKLPVHPDSCELTRLRDYAETVGPPLAVDLFCGAGGLSLGLEKAGFRVILGVDHNRYSAETHRANFGGASICADLSDRDVVESLSTALRGIKIALVAGGPPCQPFSLAGRSKIRSLIRDGIWTTDERKELWRSFVAIVAKVRPAAVLVENVPEAAVGKDSIVFRQLTSAIEDLGYNVHVKVIAASQCAVPQFRRRVFAIGTRKQVSFEWPPPTRYTPRLRDAISDLPPISGGERHSDLEYGGPQTPYQHWCRSDLDESHASRVYDHISRAVRDDDLEAFKLMDHKTRYSDLPEHLRRYRSDIFDDKYNRLHWDDLCRTITAHMARDAYWYIHPEQHRTLSIREAARIQSFPDSFRFSGPLIQAYRQIGEAVPPLMAKRIGRALGSALRSRSVGNAVRPRGIQETLRKWIATQPVDSYAAPWRAARGFWPLFIGLTIFEKLRPAVTRKFWPTYVRRWPDPKSFLDDPWHQPALRALGRERSADVLRLVATRLLDSERTLDTLLFDGTGHGSDTAEMLLAISGNSGRRPAISGVVRVAEQVFGDQANGSRVSAELLISRLVGVDADGTCYIAALEIADRFCRTTAPRCIACPLKDECAFGRRRKRSLPPLLDFHD